MDIVSFSIMVQLLLLPCSIISSRDSNHVFWGCKSRNIMYAAIEVLALAAMSIYLQKKGFCKAASKRK